MFEYFVCIEYYFLFGDNEKKDIECTFLGVEGLMVEIDN